MRDESFPVESEKGMLPDFPSIHRELNELVTQRIRTRVRAGDPVISMVGHIIQHEGDKKTYTTVEGTSRDMDYKKLGTDLTFTRDEMKTLTAAGILKKIDEAAEEMTSQVAKMMFATMSQTSEEAGTSVDNKGKPFTFDTFLEGLEKIQIDFDEESGAPIMPSMIVSPEMGGKLQAQMPGWEGNPDYTKQFDELMAKKRQEWNDRESNRKLVD